MKNNVYYSKAGAVRFVDQRTGKTYQFTLSGSPPAGISTGWEGQATGYDGFDSQSYEADPKVDGNGRSMLATYQGIGVQ